MRSVAIVSAGWYGFKPSVRDLSFREMMFEAASRAYNQAGIDPRRDVDAFVSCQEDYWEGIAISDEFAPEPLGGVLRPTFTVAGDGLLGVAQAYMMIKSGYFDVAVVESHAKPSDIVTLQEIYELAYDPVLLRPLGVANPLFIAGLDATAYMKKTGTPREAFAMVASKNKKNGLSNPRSSFAGDVSVDEILDSEPVVYPLTKYEIAGYTDVAMVFVLASGDKVRAFTDNPVWVEGVGWSTEVGTGSIFLHEWGRMPSMRMASDMAYRMAGIDNPRRRIGFAEVEDGFSHLELISLEEARLASPGEAYKMLEAGDLAKDGALPVNASGGSLSLGVPLEAMGLTRLLEAYLRLRDSFDIDSNYALVASWRGPPTYTSMSVVLRGEAL